MFTARRSNHCCWRFNSPPCILGFSNLLLGLRDEIFAPHKTLTNVVNGVSATFIWDEYLNSTGFDQILDITLNGLRSSLRTPALEHNKDITYTPKLYLFVTFGPWYINRNVNGYDVQLKRLLDVLDWRTDNSFDSVYLAPPLVPLFNALDLKHAERMTKDKFKQLVNQTNEMFNFNFKSQMGGVRYRQMEGRKDQISAYYVPVFNQLSGENHAGIRDNGGIHLLEPGFMTEARILFNHMCNNKIAQAQGSPLDGATCCVDYTKLNNHSLFKGLSLAVLAGGILVLTNSLKRAAIAFVVIGLVAGYAHLTNQTQVISKLGFEYNFTELLGMIEAWTFLILISLGLDKPRSSTGFERLFVREWKGICVSLFLIIRYSGLGEVDETFSGVIMERILLSTWTMLELYCYSVDYLESGKNTRNLSEYGYKVWPGHLFFLYF